MSDIFFKALWVVEQTNQTFQRMIVERNINDLVQNEVLIKVIYSSLNYKDALSATGHKGVTQHYPHTPGIDAAGLVVESRCTQFQAGEAVLVTGYDLGMNTCGGFAEYIRVPAEWIVKLPPHLSLQDSMIYGTAGFTAALSVFKLQQVGLKPNQGEVLVTGASGGVGSIAVALLTKLGYQVVAMTGKPQAHDFLYRLGAKTIISRKMMQDDSQRPLLKGRWAGVLDTVGGQILATALKSSQYEGCIACCGLVASAELSMTVFPFILRSIKVLGIDSVACSMDLRQKIWHLIANEWKINNLSPLFTECDLAALNDIYIDKILQGQIQGRVVVKL